MGNAHKEGNFEGFQRQIMLDCGSQTSDGLTFLLKKIN